MKENEIKLKKIYELKCPGQESYIGQTHKKLEDRWRNGKAYRPNSKVGRAIAKYGWDNIEKNVLYTGLTEEEADIIETEEIEKRGGINHPLVLNGQSGGHKGYKLSDFNLKVQSDYKATANVTLLHSLYSKKHAYNTDVYYRYDPKEMLMQAVRKLAIATEV